ncbi:hypothetical protein PAEPH01_2567 [Pancytospora epiphaga]|nr:hypothetical protein PAEPH01_2567 [Pancytospora epiphaga]
MEKIQLKKKEVRLLGSIVNGEGVKLPEDEKEEILIFKLPETKKDIK